MKKVNFSDMVAVVATRTGNSKATVKEILEANSEITRELVKDGNEVVVHKIGKFYPKERGARTSRNPMTGEVLQVPAKTGFKFKPNKDVKNLED